MSIYAPTIVPLTWLMTVGIIAFFGAITLITMAPAFKK